MFSVWLQSAAAAPFAVNLGQFKAGAGARITGASPSSGTGADVALIGDHNGDGFSDYIVPSYSRDFIVVIVMKQNTTNTDLRITDIVSDQYFRVIKGPFASGIGRSVDGVGDINGDSFDDVLIGCNGGEVDGRTGRPGYAVVIFGKAGPFTDIEITKNWPPSSVGFMILGPATSSAFSSAARMARGLGDVNGDGVNDFAISATSYAGTSAKTKPGVTYIIYGKKSYSYTTIDTLPANFGSNGIVYTGAASEDNFGYGLSPAGDFNGDGIADFLMTSLAFDPVVGGITRSNAGVAYLVFGSKTALASTDMSNFVTGSKGVRFLGAAADDFFGFGVGGVGDVNGDGIDDIAVGAPNVNLPNRADCGVVYVIFGTRTPFTADVDMSTFTDFTKGFAVYGHAASSQLCFASPAGDVNGDGVKDMLVGGVAGNCRAHIIYGQTGTRTANVDTTTDDVMTFYFNPVSFLGAGIDGGGQDITGDGIPDIVLGAWDVFVTPEGGGTMISQAGAAWMLPGPFILPTMPPTTVPTAKPTANPSSPPSMAPSMSPSVSATITPTSPSVEPSASPSAIPSVTSTEEPTLMPIVGPSNSPTIIPSLAPSVEPSVSPSEKPTTIPTDAPSIVPSVGPSEMPTITPTIAPSLVPSVGPSIIPTLVPTSLPSIVPSANPSAGPSARPSAAPVVVPTTAPSSAPTFRPTDAADKDFQLVITVEQVILSNLMYFHFLLVNYILVFSLCTRSCTT